MDTMITRRLLLRPFQAGHLSDFYEWTSRPEVGPQAGWPPVASLEDAKSILGDFIKKGEAWAMVEKNSGKLIGSVDLHRDKRRNHNKAREIGYSLHPDYWGQGYMTEAVKAVVCYAFDKTDCLILSADHYPFNQRSQRVIEKSGFQYEGTIRMSFETDTGEIYDYVCYSMTKTEYQKRKISAP